MSIELTEASEPRAVVGIGEMSTARKRGRIVTYALGSCLGISVYDPETEVGGLLHAALPSSDLDPERARREPARFVDTGVRALVRSVLAGPGDPSRLVVKAAGGASFFSSDAPEPGLEIGRRNIRALREVLDELGLSMSGGHLGGEISRTVRMILPGGTVRVEIGTEEYEL